MILKMVSGNSKSFFYIFVSENKAVRGLVEVSGVVNESQRGATIHEWTSVDEKESMEAILEFREKFPSVSVLMSNFSKVDQDYWKKISDLNLINILEEDRGGR